MSDPEHPADTGPGYPAGPGQPYHPSPDPAGGAPTAPVPPAQRSYRAESVRGVIFSRGAGWAVSAVLAGAVVALSILLAEGNNGPSAVRVFSAPARSFVGPQAGPVQRQILSPPGGIQMPGPGFAQVPPLPAACLRAAKIHSGTATPSPGGSATLTPLPSASPGQSRISITLPGGHSVTCTITVKPG